MATAAWRPVGRDQRLSVFSERTRRDGERSSVYWNVALRATTFPRRDAPRPGCSTSPSRSDAGHGCRALLEDSARRAPRVGAGGVDVIASQLAAAYPKAPGDRGVRLVPLLDSIVGDVRHQLWFLFGAAFSVLLIGCANLVNLLLAHESSRRLDLATRVALGASPMRLLRQTVTLSTMIAASGGAAGLVMAYLVVPALVAAAPPRIPRLDEVALDASVVAFTIAVSLLVGIGCGLAAYLSLGRLTGPARLAGADAGSSGGRVRHAVAVAQIAIALMLVVAAGLMVRTFRAVSALELGFDPSQVLAVGLSPNSKWDDRKTSSNRPSSST